MSAFAILESAYGTEIAQKVLDAYRTIEENFVVKKWKPSELDAGHFVEAVRRILELELTGSFTPFSGKLSNFSDTVIKSYENATGHESFRMLIPRALKSIYNIRNKRGVGHIKDISPNEMDSTYILYTVKWVLSEIVRLKSSLTIPQTQKIIDETVERQIEMIWKDTDLTRILDTKISARNQVLILLFHDSPRNESDLRSIIEYKNKTNFLKILQKLHKERFIELKSDGNCHISPTGIVEAETIILSKK
ncbi:MAG: hypothetical protein AAF998_11435 [Bacteroidota bacterium]